jgi:xanthine phosphoribosyltransferase
MPPALDAPFAPLVQRIRDEATVEQDRILRIDHFLNHRVEPQFIAELGRALAERLGPLAPDLVLTAEASGLPPALATAMALGVPMVYAKKYSPTVELPALARVIPSPTKGGEVQLRVSTRYLPASARVVIVDDFLSNGRTALALAEICDDAGAQLLAAGFVVEKLFQQGRTPLEARGVPVAALAQVERLEGGTVIMR